MTKSRIEMLRTAAADISARTSHRVFFVHKRDEESGDEQFWIEVDARAYRLMSCDTAEAFLAGMATIVPGIRVVSANDSNVRELRGAEDGEQRV